MSLSARLGWFGLALSLAGFLSVASAAGLQNSVDEAALRALATTYFNTWAAQDLDGFLRLWSAQAPELATRQKTTADLFASQVRITLKHFAVRRVNLAGDKAAVRVEADVQVSEAATGKERPGYGKLLRTVQYQREAEGWKVWTENSTFAELAARLAACKAEPERASLLAKLQTEEAEFITAELVGALINQGNRLYEQSDFPQALAIQRLAHKLAEQLGDRPGIARALNSIGNLHWVMGDYAPARVSYEQSLALSEALNDQVAVANTVRNLGNLQYVQGNWEQAAELFRRGMKLSEVLGDRLGVARGLGSLGVVADSQSDFALALDYYQQALRHFEALEDQAGEARTLGNLAIVYEQQGNYALALDHHQKSLALFEAKGDQAGTARTLHNIAIVQLIQGNYAQSLDYSLRSLRRREQLGDKPGMAKTLALLGDIYLEQGDSARALEYYQKSLTLREALNDKEGIAAAFSNLGAVQLEQENYPQALEHFRRSLALHEEMGFKVGVALSLGFLSEVYQKLGKPAEALAYAERAVAVARPLGDPNTLRQAHYTAGVAYLALNRPTQARAAFEEAIALTESLRSQIAGGEAGQQRFFESKVFPYHALVGLFVAQGQPAAALRFAERTKARALLDVLRQGRASIQKAMTPAEQAEERKLKLELTQLNAQLSRATQADQLDAQHIHQLKPRLEKARLNYEAFQTTLYAAHPELQTQRGEAPVIQAPELAALLPTTASALLEYVVTKEKTFLFAVTKTATNRADVRVFTLPVKRAELANQVESFRQQLAGADLGFRPAAVKLYELLLKPAQAQLKGKTNLVIVPDDKLWDLPFQALLTPSRGFLLEDTALAYAPSLTVLREMTKRRPSPAGKTAPATLLALGNPLLGKAALERTTFALRGEKLAPLPEAEAEVKALGQLYGPARSKVYVGAAAREDRAKAEAANARILHFATHGVLNNAAPLYSHLVLTQSDVNAAPAPKEDGLLEAWELMQLDLKADLAVLSACETARGRFGAGEGMIGLTWALFVAGVPATVVSQWKVESAGTRELMLDFHQHLRASAVAGKATKAEALRQAALKLMKNPETSHPFYWAGFVLVGDGR